MKKKKMIWKLEIGGYEPTKMRDGSKKKLIDGWMVRIDKYGYFDTKYQEDAEIISRLVRIERLLKRRKEKR